MGSDYLFSLTDTKVLTPQWSTAKAKFQVQKAVWKNWKLQKRNWKPKVSAEFMTFWLHRFRKLDVRQKSHRKMLIDTLYVYLFCTMTRW